MKHLVWLLISCLFLTVFSHETDAAQRRKSSSSSGKVTVRLYTRKDGTHVQSHTRSTPSKHYSVSRGSKKSYRSFSSHYTPSYRDKAAVGVQRDSKGKIKRSESEKKKFLKQHGYKRVPSGYEVDHITPLYKGGADKASNMQFIPKSQHKAKHHKK